MPDAVAAAMQARLLVRVGRRADASVLYTALIEADRTAPDLPPVDLVAIADAARATGDFQGAALRRIRASN